MNLDQVRESLRAKIGSPVPVRPTPPRPPILYHYTSAEGLLGIVSNNVLRASDALYMNDASELEYAKALIQEVVEAKLIAGCTDRGHEFLTRCARDNFSILAMLQPYLACFCQNGDLLSQWRAYAGRGGGYAIGFDAGPLGRPSLSLTGTTDATLLSVEYARPTQRSLIEERVDSICRALDECSDENPTVDMIPVACMLFRETLADLVWSFKHAAFQEEREWRLVCLRDRRFAGQFDFRSGHGFLSHT